MTRRTITFEDLEGNRSRVTWVEIAEAANPLMRYVLLLSARSINANLSGMLAAVAQVVLVGPAEAP